MVAVSSVFGVSFLLAFRYYALQCVHRSSLTSYSCPPFYLILKTSICILLTTLAFQSGPALVAWLGGSHTDSRFRRGMGGTLHPEYDVGEERMDENQFCCTYTRNLVELQVPVEWRIRFGPAFGSHVSFPLCYNSYIF
jgi:hypothetical protein